MNAEVCVRPGLVRLRRSSACRTANPPQGRWHLAWRRRSIRAIATCSSLIVLAGCDKSDPARPIPTDSTALRVTSTPAGATVFVNGARRGVTPVTVPVAPGTHFVSVHGQNCVVEDSVTALRDSVMSFDRRLYVLDAIYEVGPLYISAFPGGTVARIATKLSSSSDNTGYVVVAQQSFDARRIQGDLYRIAFFAGGSASYVRLIAGDSASYEAVGVGPDQSIYLMTWTGVGGRRVERLTIDGMAISSWGGPGSGPGQFGAVQVAGAMVVSPAGDVHAYDPGNARVQRFSAIGDYVSSWPTFCCQQALACDAGGNVYLNADQYGPGIQRRDENGTLLGTIPNAHSDASFYADDSCVAVINGREIVRYDFEGRVTHRIGSEITPLGATGDRVGRIYVVGYSGATNLSKVLVFSLAGPLTTGGHVRVFRPAPVMRVLRPRART